MEKVLVTGASGYIALHCITELLKNGYAVKGSLRSMNRENEVREAVRKEVSDNNLEICELDLLNDEGWDNAASECEYMLHLASPFIVGEPKSEDELIRPAKEGTMRALKAAKKAGIKKIVLTSSIVAIAYGHDKKICSGDDWTNTQEDVGAYTKSKTLAEKDAWNFINADENKELIMTTIHPGFVMGPLLSDDTQGASADFMAKMILGKFPALPDVYMHISDVRDTAKLHVQALKSDESDGKRILTTSSKDYHITKIAKIAKDNGFSKISTKIIPTLIFRVLALFNREMKGILKNIKRGSYSTDTSPTVSIFNWEPTPIEKTVSDMALSMSEILKRKRSS